MIARVFEDTEFDGRIGDDATQFTQFYTNEARTWQGLEAEDLAQIESDEFWQVGNHMAIAMAVEAALKKKNT